MKILIIQTAFIGDVILATPIIEKLHSEYPNATLDFLLRKGNEGLLENHPFLNEVLIWDKKQGKYKQMLRIIGQIRANKYDCVINLQRFFSTGLISVLSRGNIIIGFDKNPLSYLYSIKVPHIIGSETVHEVDRNLSLLKSLVKKIERVRPCLYPHFNDFTKVIPTGLYITISPTSVWFTKQYPQNKWVDLINQIPTDTTIYLLGGKTDFEACEQIINSAERGNISNMCGQLSFLQSAALMKNAQMNYVNDSAPMHLASAVNAPVTAIFCSTIPAFGFGPLSENSKIVEVSEKLDCRPCGLHGYKACPKGHFKCAEISASEIV
jgi:ADP-heptose:LPS heptosyltransferase